MPFQANVRRTVRENWSPPFRPSSQRSRAPGLRQSSGVVDPEDTQHAVKRQILLVVFRHVPCDPPFPIGNCRHSPRVQLAETVGELSDLVESVLVRPLNLELVFRDVAHSSHLSHFLLDHSIQLVGRSLISQLAEVFLEHVVQHQLGQRSQNRPKAWHVHPLNQIGHGPLGDVERLHLRVAVYQAQSAARKRTLCIFFFFATE